MKTKWSALSTLTLLFTLASCGAEQFGSVPQSSTSNPDPIKAGEQLSCTSHTLIKPKVDILYVFDNSPSYRFSSQDLQKAVAGTISKVSSQFDYRVVSTSLINPPSKTNPFDDYRVLTNSLDELSDEANSRKALNADQMVNFYAYVNEMHEEKGLSRVREFIDHHRVQPKPLFRKEAYTLIILVSNGMDDSIEEYRSTGGNYEIPGRFNLEKSKYDILKSSLNAKQLRMLSVTAHSECKTGWVPSTHSYVRMSQALHSTSDSFDLCSTSNISTLFDSVNSTIQQVIVPHVYKYWPITLANQNIALDAPEQDLDTGTLEIYKTSVSGAPTLIPSSQYTLKDFGSISSRNILTTTTPSQNETARHFVEFTGSSKPTYPDCIQIKSTTKVERFGYIVLPRKPILESIHVTIGPNALPASDWEYTEAHLTHAINIKIPISGVANSDKPEVMRNGYMIKLKNGRYYESGQNVQVNYLPAPIQ